MNSLMVSDGTVPWSGSGTSRNSRIPVSPAIGIRRSKSTRNEQIQDLRHSDKSNHQTSRYTSSGNRPVNTATGELDLRKRRSRAAEVSPLKLTTNRPFSVESSPSSLSSSAVEDPAPLLLPPVNERLNAAMEKLFELYRRQERRGSLGGSDTDASLTGGGGGGVEEELGISSGRVRSRKKRRISVRRSKSSLVDKSRSFSHDSVPSVGHSQTVSKDQGRGSLNTTQQRHGKYAESPVRDRRVVTYEKDHPRVVAKKFVPPKATGVVLTPRSRSCGLTRPGSQREASSSSRYPDAGTRAQPRTRSHESTERGRTPGQQRNQRDASGTGTGTSEQRASYEPRRSRYESHRMRNIVAEDIPKADHVNQDEMEAMLKSDRYGGRRNEGTDLRRSVSTRGPYRSDEALNRDAVRKTQRVDGVRQDVRHTGSMSKIPLARTFTTTRKMVAPGTEQSGSGSESEADLSRSRLSLRKGHRNESIGDTIDPGTILISNRSLWFVDRRNRSHPPRLEQVALPSGLDHLVRSIMQKHLLQPKSSSSNNNTSDNSNDSNDSYSRNISSSGQ